jgi:hypothetical protein
MKFWYFFASFAGLFIQIVFMLKREWLLRKPSFLIILILTLVLLGISCVLIYAKLGNPKIARLLAMPLPSFGTFVLMKYLFLKIYNRNPVDTFWSMDFREMPDGIFNFLFWVLSILLSAVFAFEVL